MPKVLVLHDRERFHERICSVLNDLCIPHCAPDISRFEDSDFVNVLEKGILIHSAGEQEIIIDNYDFIITDNHLGNNENAGVNVMKGIDLYGVVITGGNISEVKELLSDVSNCIDIVKTVAEIENILNVWKYLDYDCVKLGEYFSIPSRIYELVYDVLSTCLILDIEFQLEDNQQRWSEEIERLRDKEKTIKDHMDSIRSLMIKQKGKLTSEISDTFKCMQANGEELFNLWC